MAAGGIATGIVVLVIGVVWFLATQHVISLNIDFWALCALGVIALGLVILVGTVYAQRMMRGGWRKWMMEEDRPGPP